MKKINQKSTHQSKMSTILLTCLVLVAVFSIMPVLAYAETAIPDATSQFYVNDFADIFTDEEEARLIETAVSLADEHDGIQVVVTTIESLGGETMEHYALEMYNKYGIGKNDMGLLILLSTGDREIRVEVGRAMEAYITDSKAGRFIDNYAIPYLAENKFSDGLINLQEAFVKEIISCVEKEAAVVATVPKQNTATSPATEKKTSSFSAGAILGNIFVIAMISLIVIVIYKLTIEKKHKNEISSLEEQLEIEKHSNKAQMSRLSSEHSDKVRTLTQRLETSEKNYNSLLQEHNTLRDHYSRAKTLHPGLDGEISAMIAEEIRQKDMAIAENVDITLNKVVGLRASKDIVGNLENALSEYSRLSETQKSYVTSDVSKVRKLYNASLELQKEYEREQEIKHRKSCAAAALTSITAIIACISVGKASHLPSLQRAKSIYDNLDSGSRNYFNRDVADKLENLLAQAKRDKRRIEEEEEAERRRRRQQEEERRRRQQSMHRSHSSSSFGGSRSHSGFGGRSGGGGAGRKF